MESMRVFCVDHLLKLVSWKGVHRTLSMDALQGTNISLPKAWFEDGFFLFPRWDKFVPWKFIFWWKVNDLLIFLKLSEEKHWGGGCFGFFWIIFTIYLWSFGDYLKSWNMDPWLFSAGFHGSCCWSLLGTWLLGWKWNQMVEFPDNYE